MGLDVVEVVMRCEEEFGVSLENGKLEKMRTVGDLYELVCEQLRLQFGPEAPAPQDRLTAVRVRVPRGGWSRDAVWAALVWVCADQLQVALDEIRYSASFVEDLGAD